MMKLNDELLMLVFGGQAVAYSYNLNGEEENPYSDGKNVPGGNEDIYRKK